jgi:uncharacterized protein YggE
LKAAKEKALKMAAVFGQSVGLPIEISESDYRYPYNDFSYTAQTLTNAPSSYSPSLGETANTITLCKIAIRAGVNVTFELKR